MIDNFFMQNQKQNIIIFFIKEALLYSIFPLFNFLMQCIFPHHAQHYHPNIPHIYRRFCRSLLRILVFSQIYNHQYSIFHQAKCIIPFHVFDFASTNLCISPHSHVPLLLYLTIYLRQTPLQTHILFALKLLFHGVGCLKIRHYIYFHHCKQLLHGHWADQLSIGLHICTHDHHKISQIHQQHSFEVPLHNSFHLFECSDLSPHIYLKRTILLDNRQYQTQELHTHEVGLLTFTQNNQLQDLPFFFSFLLPLSLIWKNQVVELVQIEHFNSCHQQFF